MLEIVFAGLVSVLDGKMAPFSNEAFLVGLVLRKLADMEGNALVGYAAVVVI